MKLTLLDVLIDEREHTIGIHGIATKKSWPASLKMV